MHGSAVALVVASLLLASCSFPRDIHGTTDEVRERGVLRAGAVSGAVAGDPPAGQEASAVEAFAAKLGVRVEWTVAAEHELMRRLERRDLDAVVGGLDPQSPYQKLVALTEAGGTVVAVPPGENSWLLRWHRFLEGRA